MKHSGHKLSDLSPYIRAQIEGKPFATAFTPDKPRLKQDTKGPNKTERAFHEWLKMAFPGALVSAQAITVRLGNGVRYTPDFMVYRTDKLLTFFETKGHMRDDAAVKIKVAAFAYPFWEFNLVTAKDRSLRAWEIQRILP